MPLPELQLVERIRRLAEELAPAAQPPVVVQGIGDDCAVLRLSKGSDTLVTTDQCIEGVHFRREWYPAGFIGRQCLTRGLSDIAAMGGEPVAAFLSLALPEKLPQAWLDGFLRGMLATAMEFQTKLAGGDISTSPGGVQAGVTVVGRVPRGRAVLRSRAKAGDALYVTGALGGAAAMVGRLRSGRRFPTAAQQPTPRTMVGPKLRRIASAMIDTSDGLSTDLMHICGASNVGAIVYAPALPAPAGLELALHGGEDYELLFTAPARKKVPSMIAGVPISRIGEIVREKKLWLVDSHGRMRRLRAGGWEHFSD